MSSMESLSHVLSLREMLLLSRVVRVPSTRIGDGITMFNKIIISRKMIIPWNRSIISMMILRDNDLNTEYIVARCIIHINNYSLNLRRMTTNEDYSIYEGYYNHHYIIFLRRHNHISILTPGYTSELSTPGMMSVSTDEATDTTLNESTLEEYITPTQGEIIEYHRIHNKLALHSILNNDRYVISCKTLHEHIRCNNTLLKPLVDIMHCSI